MAKQKPLVLVNGSMGQLGSGDIIAAVPTALPYASLVTLDVAAYSVFEIGALTGDLAFIFANAADGCAGVVWVVQNATGGYRVGWRAPVGFIVNEDATLGSDVSMTANVITRYSYTMYVLGGQGYVDIDRSVRSQTVNVVTTGGSRVFSSGARVIMP